MSSTKRCIDFAYICLGANVYPCIWVTYLKESKFALHVLLLWQTYAFYFHKQFCLQSGLWKYTLINKIGKKVLFSNLDNFFFPES